MTGCEQDSNAGSTLEMQLTVAVADLVECLREKTAATEKSKFDCCPVSTLMCIYLHCFFKIHANALFFMVQLLTFLPHSEGGQMKPNFNMKFVSYQPSRIMQKVRNPTKPEVHIR